MRVTELPKNHTQLRSNAQVAIILANELPWSPGFEPIRARVGALPVLLRAILGVQATNPERTIVVVIHCSRCNCELRQRPYHPGSRQLHLPARFASNSE